MSLLLCIDTAQETASVCITEENRVVASLVNDEVKEHAAWLHQSIQNLLQENKLSLKDIQAVSVSNGPGSYTGLRVGLSAAKGLCYALNIPLITLSTLKIMAQKIRKGPGELLCPLIDARRMEVFTAVYDHELNERLNPSALIIDENSFAEFLSNEILIFTGSGSQKLHAVIQHPNARFTTTSFEAADQAELAHYHWKNGQFSDLAYAEPFYIKEFYSPPRKLSL